MYTFKNKMIIQNIGMKNIVVTGANGFLGKALALGLVARGYYVYAIIRENKVADRELLNNKNIEIISCDMENYQKLTQEIKENEIEGFYHFAWEGSAGEKRCDEKIQLKNVFNTCEAVKVAEKLNAKKFIFASSIMEYEVSELMKTDKNVSLSTIYSTSKITANYMSRAIANDCGISYISAIISNVYGIGEKSKRFIVSNLEKMLKNEETIFSEGEQLYDFIYISDAVNIFIEILEKAKANETYYIGNREQRKLKEFIKEMAEVVAPRKELGIGRLHFTGVSLNYDEFDTSLVEVRLGYKPRVSFKEGIRKTVEWMKSERSLYCE